MSNYDEASFINLTKELKVAPNKYSYTPKKLTRMKLWDTYTLEKEYPERFPGYLYNIHGDKTIEMEIIDDHLFSSRARRVKKDPPTSDSQQKLEL